MTVSAIFFILALAAMVGVLISLIWGVLVMTKSKEEDRERSQKMMQYRVWLQGLALLFLVLAAAAG